MSWIDFIAYNRNIRGEEPNKELAKELIESNSLEGIKEIADYLHDKNKSIASDCIAVLYNVGYIEPKLIAGYADIFLDLLNSKNNRMVWGGMIALSTIAEIKAELLFSKVDYLLDITRNGSLITQIHGINTFIKLSLCKNDYKEKLLPVLFDYLDKCRPIDFGKRVELTLSVIESEEEKDTFEKIIHRKSTDLSDSQRKKLKTIINRYNKKSELIKIVL